MADSEPGQGLHRTFSSRVRGPHARDIDVTLAKLAADVYQEASGPDIDGWRPLTEQELASAGLRKEMLVDARSGFAARIYADGDGNYVLAFRGTDEGKDWVHNVKQGLGFEDAQYKAADRLALKAYRAFGADLAITGHSLGGGLATLGAAVSGAPAVTFNSSGLTDASIRRSQRDPDAVREAAEHGLIRRYAVDHELLTGLQERNLLTRGLLPDAVGHKIELPDPHPVHGWKTLVPTSSLRHGLELHGMESVMEAQQLAAQGPMTDPAHPANGMFNAALSGLRGIRPDVLGYQSDEQYRNAAGSLVGKASEAGMQRIDHVVIGGNGALFGVEGPLEDASHRIASVDKTQAASQPIETSSRQLDRRMEAEANAQPQQVEMQRRTLVMP